MRTLRREMARIWACVTDRSRGHLVLAAVVSLWTLAWVIGQAVAPPMTPLDVPRSLMSWADIPTGWLDNVTEWARNPDRSAVLGLVAIAGGLLWAAGTERAQFPAVLGWLAVLVAAEGIGYHPAVLRAVLAMVGFIAVLTLVSLPGKVSVMMNRIVLIPKDVIRAGATAAAMAAMVPLLVPGLAIVRLLRPYVTHPPRVPAPREPATKTLVRD
ncbi:hypothetical protein [Actinocrispum sp. NPDC049592]|uniref:hypothetical protein n=1 Tax=Actinocrispum sp. NPDC049592 TaxID=3154835 RepID=UPI00342F2640